VHRIGFSRPHQRILFLQAADLLMQKEEYDSGRIAFALRSGNSRLRLAETLGQFSPEH
jgi:hypothetical protein